MRSSYIPHPSRRDDRQRLSRRPASRRPALAARPRPGRAAGPPPRARGHRGHRLERLRPRPGHRRVPAARDRGTPGLRAAAAGAELRRSARHAVRRARLRHVRAGLCAAQRRELARLSRARRSGLGPRAAAAATTTDGHLAVVTHGLVCRSLRDALPEPAGRRGGPRALGEHLGDGHRAAGAVAGAAAQLHRPSGRPRHPGPRPTPRRCESKGRFQGGRIMRLADVHHRPDLVVVLAAGPRGRRRAARSGSARDDPTGPSPAPSSTPGTAPPSSRERSRPPTSRGRATSTGCSSAG